MGTHPFIKMSIASAHTHRDRGGVQEKEEWSDSFGQRRWRLFTHSSDAAFVYKQSSDPEKLLWKTTGIPPLSYNGCYRGAIYN